FHQDPAFEIQPAAPTQVLVEWSRETIRTAVLTATVAVDAVSETDIGTVVARENRLRAVVEELCLRVRSLLRRTIRIGFHVQLLEAIRRVKGRASRHGGRHTRSGRVHLHTLRNIVAPPALIAFVAA